MKATRSRPLRERVRGALAMLWLALATLAFGLLALGIDDRLLERGLYYQRADAGVHRASDDTSLLYELSPGATLSDEAVYGPYDVSIGPLGSRAPRVAAEPGDALRVLVVGGSTVYGAGVDDDQTLPAALEALLEERISGRAVEVWNYGTSAYTMHQVRVLTERVSATLAPDVVIVQRFNAGRRPFLEPGPNVPRPLASGVFERNPALYPENFPAPADLAPYHRVALRWDPLYRALLGTLGAHDERAYDGWEAYDASLLSHALESVGVPVLFVTLPLAGRSETPLFEGLPRDREIALADYEDTGDHDPVHPPAPILARWAGHIADVLLARVVDATGRPTLQARPVAPPVTERPTTEVEPQLAHVLGFAIGVFTYVFGPCIAALHLRSAWRRYRRRRTRSG